MTKEEFLELLGKGKPGEDKKLIAAVEKVLEEHASDSSVEHADTDKYLEHYGIEGQKWGVQNGPPYPLSRAKKAHLSKAARAKVVLKHIDDLTNEELQQWLKRIELETKIEDIAKGDKKKGKSYILRILSKSGDTLIDKVVPNATFYAFKTIMGNTLGSDIVDEMFPQNAQKAQQKGK